MEKSEIFTVNHFVRRHQFYCTRLLRCEEWSKKLLRRSAHRISMASLQTKIDCNTVCCMLLGFKRMRLGQMENAEYSLNENHKWVSIDIPFHQVHSQQLKRILMRENENKLIFIDGRWIQLHILVQLECICALLDAHRRLHRIIGICVFTQWSKCSINCSIYEYTSNQHVV